MHSNLFKNFSIRELRRLILLLAIISTSAAQGQISCGIQTGKYLSYLGDVTLPGYGGYLGIKARTGEKFAMHYQLSFLRVAGKYESFPMDNDMETNIENETNLVYQNDLSVNLTNLAIEGNLIVFSTERVSIDADFGIGIGVMTFFGSQTRPYETNDFSSSPDRSGFLGLSIGLGSEYLWTEKYSLRAQLGCALGAQMYYETPLAKMGLSLGIVRNSY